MPQRARDLRASGCALGGDDLAQAALQGVQLARLEVIGEVPYDAGDEQRGRLGDEAAFLSAGGYHHHIGLNTWESRGGSPPPRHATGLYHVAIRYPTRAALARALRALLERRYPLDGASDHGVSEAIYLRDPDGNGIELYWDRPREAWPKLDGGGYAMTVDPLDLDDLLAAADADAGESTAEAADRDQARPLAAGR